MTGQDLWNEISTLRATLDLEITTLKSRGKKKAQCEAEYRKGLAIKILKERANGVPVTIISDICRGDKEIAALKLERDIAETLYEVCQQAIYKTKMEIGVVDRQMQAERKGL